MTVVFRNLLRLVSWPVIWSIPESVLWVLQNEYSAIVGWSVLYCFLGLIGLWCLFKSLLLYYCLSGYLDVLSECTFCRLCSFSFFYPLWYFCKGHMVEFFVCIYFYLFIFVCGCFFSGFTVYWKIMSMGFPWRPLLVLLLVGRLVVSNSLQPYGLQYRLPCPSLSPRVCLNSCIESVMPSNHLILCHTLLLLPSVFPSIRVFSSESAVCIMWPKYWSFSFSISPSNEYSGLISFGIE